MYDYICSKALAWDSPISLVANMPELDRHPRTDDNLLAINLWETAKLDKTVPDSMKRAMRDPDTEWTIMPRRGGKVEIVKVTQLTTDSLNAVNPVRAFSYVIDDATTGIIYWNGNGESTITLPGIMSKQVELYSFDGKRLKTGKDKDGNLTLPAGYRRVLHLKLPEREARDLFINTLLKQ